MRIRTKRKKCKYLLILLLTLSLLLICGMQCSQRLEKAMSIFAQTKGNAMLSADLQTTLYQTLSEQNIELVTLTKDVDEHITSIQIHSVAISLLASKMTVQILETLRNYQNSDFGIPLGNLTESALLSGRGPKIPVRPVSTGNAASELRSTLESAGINQTLHRVFIHFVVTVSYLAPLEACADTIAFDIVLAETLIVGEVPILYRE